MKKIITIAFVITALSFVSCKSNNNKYKENSNTAETSSQKDEVTQQGETAIDNAGKAKRPKGTLTFKIDGESFSANENTVQCMFIGMGSKDLAQGMISGNCTGTSVSQVSGIMMTKPETGEVKSKGTVSTTGLMIIKDGVQYGNKPDAQITINITKITPDGNNYYIGGTFSGTLKSDDGKTITVTDGVFESAYL
jgi:hypothetical protein